MSAQSEPCNESTAEDMCEIQHVGSLVIRSVAETVIDYSYASQVADQLVRTLNKLRGAGLAAPQIGIPLRIFVVQIHQNELFPDREESPLNVMINPQMEICGSDPIIEWEACFSIPGYTGRVPRHAAVRVSWTEKDSRRRQETFTGYLARVMQHEFDHLNGMVYMDRMTDMRTFSTTENYLRNKYARR